MLGRETTLSCLSREGLSFAIFFGCVGQKTQLNKGWNKIDCLPLTHKFRDCAWKNAPLKESICLLAYVFFLEYNCLTVLFISALQPRASALGIHIPAPSWRSLPPHLPQVITEHQSTSCFTKRIDLGMLAGPSRENAVRETALGDRSLMRRQEGLEHRVNGSESVGEHQGIGVSVEKRSRSVVSDSLQFSRSEYWSGSPFPGDLPHPGIESRSPALQILDQLSHQGSPRVGTQGHKQEGGRKKTRFGRPPLWGDSVSLRATHLVGRLPTPSGLQPGCRGRSLQGAWGPRCPGNGALVLWGRH